MRRMQQAPKVRICAYPAEWLLVDGFGNSSRIFWSTGIRTQSGDIQVFAVSSTLGDASELINDQRRDAVHSLWRAVGAAKTDAQEQWPVAAPFQLLVKLRNPVHKSDLLKAGLLKKQWPHHWQGKLLRTPADVARLADLLAKRNPNQRRAIYRALGVTS